MRAANVIVVGLGLIGVAFAVVISWKWRQLPLRNTPPVTGKGDGFRRFRIAARTVGAACTAGAIAGVLVLGLVGRLVMRILAATSSDAQGLLTEADEIVGEITYGGTFGFIIFVGLFGGLVSALVYLIIRAWLPTEAGKTGIIFGVIAIGTLGVSDALSTRNSDFTILTPLWLAILLLVATGFLFATTFAALAARLDRFAQVPGRGRGLLYPALVISLVPPLGFATAAHLGARTFAPARLAAFTQSAKAQKFGRIVLGALTLLTAIFILNAVAKILTA